MIKATFYFKNEVPYGFSIEGHAEFSKRHAGKNDIVCASVSSVAYMVANTITDIMNINADIEESDGKLKVLIEREQTDITKDILLGLKLHLEELNRQYPKNVYTITEV